MAKYLGQLEGLDNVKDKCNNAAHTGNDSLPRGSVCPDSHKAGQKGHHQEEKSKESAPAGNAPNLYGGGAAVSQSDNMDALKKMHELLEAGIITQAEFDAKKKQLLGL